jgi:predicted TIM-barrel fold metal-dependent hydrolase
MVIDCLAQVGSGETWQAPKRQVNYTPEQILDRTQEAGIDRLCIMAPRNPSYEKSNREVARVCEKYPDKFIGFAVHSPQREAGRIRAALVAEVKSLGLRGLRVDGHPTREVLEVSAELGIPVIYYPDESGGAGPARRYHMIATAYPTVNFILPHLGSYRSRRWWAHIEAIDLCKRYPNVHLETSGIAYLKYLIRAAKELPAEKMLFGSCAPELDPRVEIYSVRLLKLSTAQEAEVLGGNIQRLLEKQ